MDAQKSNEEQRNNKATVKKIITISVITLAILFPTILAIFLGKYIEDNRDISGLEDVEVTLFDSNGDMLFTQVGVDGESSESSLVKIFSAISSNIVPSNSEPDLSKYGDSMIAEIKNGSSISTLTCYFSMGEQESFCTDSSGQLYLIPQMYCDYFLDSHFAESLYMTAVPPTLITGDYEQILPYDASWSYLNTSGNFLRASLFKKTDRKLTFTMTGGISLNFSVQPDECTVSVLDGANIVFSGTLAELQNASLTDSANMTISMHAVWEKQSVRSYYGEQHFEFQVSVKNKAEFFTDTLNVGTDQLILISAKNVSDLSKLTFTSQFVETTPTFQKNGDIAYALFSPPLLEVDDEITFTVSYGITSKEFTAKISAPQSNAPESSSSILDIKFKNASSRANKHIFLNIPFTEVDSKYFTKGTEYGAEVDLLNNKFNSPFTEYLCVNGTAISVRSLNSGLVLFTGESETLGKYVIIDLGLELKIWYCYLDSVSVTTGDYVAVGDVLGTSGALILSSNPSQGFCTMFTYRERIIAPDCVFEKQAHIS